jgi:hypothetical protein
MKHAVAMTARGLMSIAITLSMGAAVMAAETTQFEPTFFDSLEPIEVYDPLAVALGALERDRPLVYRYEDAIKLAGHSCPAVSGGFKLTQLALTELYPDGRPLRGGITVRVRGDREHKVNGPLSAVVGLITGAAPETGFSGLTGGMFSRKNLLRFDAEDAPPEGCVFSAVFTRSDTGRSVDITYRNDMLPAAPAMGKLMPGALSGQADDAELAEFGRLWHERIEIILSDPPEGMFTIKSD